MKTITLFCLLLAFASASAQIVHVPADYPSIQQGIDAASPGDTVLVADGTYYEQVIFIWGKSLLVTSNFILDGDSTHLYNTILDGSQLPNGDASVVKFLDGTDTTSVISGFTIQNGRGTICGGGGIFLQNSGGKIINNRIIQNTVICATHQWAGGGGILAYNYEPDSNRVIIVRNNFIDNNFCYGYEAGGSGIFTNIKIICERNIISNNEVDSYAQCTGGGICVRNSDSQSLIKDNFFKGNIASMGIGGGIGGGLFLEGVGSNIENNTFIENQAYVGGAIYSDCGNIIRNNIFYKNSAGYGGGIYFSLGSYGIILNNTFSENIATIEGGSVCASFVNLLSMNNIFWNNSALIGGEISSANAQIVYSNIDTAKIHGTFKLLEGNIFEDPLFCQNELLMPDALSPCIDAGIGQFIFNTESGPDTCYAPAYDILMHYRPLDYGYDMGAYEVQIIGIAHHETGTGLSVYPNPFTHNLYCKYRLDKTSDVIITIYDIMGRIKTSWHKSQGAGDHNTPVELQELHNGIYLLELKINDRSVTKRVIKYNQ